MQVPDALLGFHCFVFMVLKNEMQVFISWFFISPYPEMSSSPRAHYYSGDALRLKPTP